MKCPTCGSSQVVVTESRSAGATRTVIGKERRLTPRCVEKRWGNNFVYRKRSCISCSSRWSTVEIVITKKGHRARSVAW